MSMARPHVTTTDPDGLFPYPVLRTLPLAPEWRSPDKHAWHGHIPFARWLLTQAVPRRLVELGVHKGDSYCTFCETIARHGLPTKAWGVDSWEGDSHAGHYGESVYQTLKAYHDPRYGGFSTLVRSLFTDAARDVADGSVDLCHIDGLHTYEAVREDFDTWLPKMSPAGVMLFHDIAERQTDFGVWRLWQEVTERYPAFTFTHSSGLGVLAVGKAPAAAVRWLTGLPEDEAAQVRDFFQAMGDGLQQTLAIRRLEDQIVGLETRVQSQAETHHRLQVALNVSVERLSEAVREAYEDIGPYVRSLEADLERREAESREVQDKLNAVLSTRSWKMTAPMRVLMSGRIGPYGKALILRTLHRLPGGSRLLEMRARLMQQAREVIAKRTGPDLEAAKVAFRARTDADLRALLEGTGRVCLPASARPRVSVVLVLWNQAAFTLACLRGLASEHDVPIEVVIVDNASTDETGALLDRVDGARVIRNTDNVGFLKAVNQAVPETIGEHVLLLNNDAVMRPGSLLAAVRALESDTSVGAVGGRIVLPNGRLQEAGSIIWRDGSCLGYARDLAPEAGEAMFRRDVDYCSGAFLLFRRKTFLDLGGFDESFAPAYYEEADFCMRLRAAGLRVIYEPLAVIDHFEFGSAGKSEHALAQQRKNHGAFRSKHAAVLDAAHEPPDPARTLTARQRLPAGTETVLVIDDRVPLPPLGAGYPRACTLLRAIAESGRFVTFYPLDTPDEDWDETYTWLPRGVEVAMGKGRLGLEAFLRERRTYYDTVIVSRPHNMRTVRELMDANPNVRPTGRLIYDAEAVFAVRDLHKSRLAGHDAAETARAQDAILAELSLAEGAAQVVSVSEMEAARFRGAGHADVHVLGHSLVTHPTPRPVTDRHGLLFVGALKDEDSPNVDSLLWFHREVLPLIRGRLGRAADVMVAGRDDAPSIRGLRGQGLTLLGRVPDLTDLYDKARVFIAPTRYAGGIPHKIHEAAAHGLPVVATPLLAEQLGWRDGADLLVGGTPEAFADQIARLYTDDALWETVRANALRRIETECDPAAFRSKVRAILDDPRDRP